MFSKVLFAEVAAGALALVLATGTTLPATSPFQPMPEVKVNQAHKEKARQVAGALLTAWREGRFEPLSDDFTLEMAQGLPPEDQKKAHASLRALFGDFVSLEFFEAVTSLTLPDCVMYRFKGTFSSTDARPEVRVLMDDEGTVAGFWVMHWKDEVH